MALREIGPHEGYDSWGFPIHKPPSLSLPTPDYSISHQGRFLIAIGGAVILTTATCVFPPAAGGAIICYAAAINEARQIPELNQPTL